MTRKPIRRRVPMIRRFPIPGMGMNPSGVANVEPLPSIEVTVPFVARVLLRINA